MFKRKKLQNSVRAGVLAVATAMAGMGTAVVSTSASAVSIAPNGLGEAMIFPYYTGRNGFASFFNITNTSNKTVFIKVRWNEGENSRDARDFNVILSPYDVWSVATTGSPSGAARAITADNTCTSPVLPRINANTTGVDFTNAAYTGRNFDTGNTGLDRTREGYFTVFQMGVLIDPTTNSVAYTALSADQKALADTVRLSAEHSNVRGNAGIPGAGDDLTTDLLGTNTNCSVIDRLFTDDTTLATLAAVVTEPENVLKGRAVLIELSTGVAHGFDPVVFENFYSPNGVDTAAAGDLLALPSQDTPNLSSVSPATAQYVRNAQLIQNSYVSGVDAISDLLSRNAIINDYNITSGSQTDWVITFPTKAFYVDREITAGVGNFFKLPAPPAININGNPLAPFNNGEVFADPDLNNDGIGDINNSAGESCVSLGNPQIWDREEFIGANAASNFSPIPEDGGVEICKEANILSFGNSNIFDSKLRSALFEGNVGGMPGLNGWARIAFANAGVLTPVAATGTANMGLPVVGMRLEARQNPKFAGKSFGFSSDHAYE